MRKNIATASLALWVLGPSLDTETAKQCDWSNRARVSLAHLLGYTFTLINVYPVTGTALRPLMGYCRFPLEYKIE